MDYLHKDIIEKLVDKGITPHMIAELINADFLECAGLLIKHGRTFETIQVIIATQNLDPNDFWGSVHNVLLVILEDEQWK